MKITLESTERMVEINGVPARIWEGESERGVKVVALIASIAVHKDDDRTEVEADLCEHKLASDRAIEAYPLRMLLP